MSKEKTVKRNCLDILQYLNLTIQSKRSAGKEGTASLYEATRNRLNLFLRNKPMSMKEIDHQVVYTFEKYLRTSNLGINSVTNYMSIFRAVYNRAVVENLIRPLENPFQNLKLRPVSTGKRSISMDVMMDIIRLNLSGNLDFARDLFIFCFMACGMSFVDLVHLTRSNIINNTIVYRRIKTKTEIRISITAGMQQILDKYVNKDSFYLFPILKKESTYAQYKVALRTYNRRLERIASMLPYGLKLTSYVARHSWAMQAKENNVPITVIGEALGHTSEKTTNFYLSNLDQSVLDKANKKIIAMLDAWIIKRPVSRE